MSVNLARRLASELRCQEGVILAALRLLTVEEKSVPFVARYRADATGNLSPSLLRQILDAFEENENLSKRKEYVLKKVSAPDARAAIVAAETLAEVEELYEPYKSRKKTKADEAREQFPEAEQIAQDLCKGRQVSKKLKGDLRSAVGLLCAEIVSQKATEVTLNIVEKARLRVISAPENHTYRDYEKRVIDIPHYAWQAIARDKSDLRLSFGGDDSALALLASLYPKVPEDFHSDAWKRLLKPRITRRIFNTHVAEAKEDAANCFADNLRPLLLTPPLRRVLSEEHQSKHSIILGLDPGYQSGHKLAWLRISNGSVLETTTLPVNSQHIQTAAKGKLVAVAIGDGQNTHGARRLVQLALPGIPIYIIREAGASVYSASPLAELELPSMPVAHRGAVSIARRLLDPLSEYIKVEPSCLGVGMYQKDAAGAVLEKKLSAVVEDIVAQVGVDANTASPSLLRRVAGISSKAAEKLRSCAPFKTRAEIAKKVFPKDANTYDNVIGFLRVVDGPEPLDGTRIHPEDYERARTTLRKAGISDAQLRDLIKKGGGFDASISKRLSSFPALQDPELCGDPRHSTELLNRAQEVQVSKTRLDECQPGDVFRSAIVSNVVAFGAFIDCGLDKAGLLHVSRFRGQKSHISVGATIDVRVEAVDLDRRRLSLSLLIDEKITIEIATRLGLRRPRDEASFAITGDGESDLSKEISQPKQKKRRTAT